MWKSLILSSRLTIDQYMKFFLLLSFCYSICFTAASQYKVRFIVKDMAEIKRDSIFISGTFNNWDSLANKKYKLEDYSDGRKAITLDLPVGDLRYKYTGGNWYTVEKEWDGDELPGDRLLTVTGDMEIKDTVVEWRDLYLKDKWLALSKSSNDTDQLRLQATLAASYAFNSDLYNIDSSFAYVRKALETLQKIKSSDDLHSWPGYNSWMVSILGINASVLHTLGNYLRSLELRLEILKLAEQEKKFFNIINGSIDIADDYLSMKDYSNALEYCRKARSALSKADVNDPSYGVAETWIDYHSALCFSGLSLPDSVFLYTKYLYEAGLKYKINYAIASACKLFGDYFSIKGPLDSAFYYYQRAIPLAYKTFLVQIGISSEKGVALLFQKKGQVDSALAYARAALASVEQNKTQLQTWTENPDSYIADISPLIAELYKSRHQLDSAYKYLQLSVELKDSLYNVDKIRQFQNLTFNESIRQQQEIQKEKEAREKYQTRLKFYGLAFGIAGLLFLAIVLYRNNKQKQKANGILTHQKKKIENTLNELQRTQKQLIQAEKMASLGELTAGIAREIQNPLNFVNNFSEVNKELIDELTSELAVGNTQSAVEIAANVRENEEKINHHGKRADAIVRGMLQHSRTSTGQKEPTDINALADEYVRLAYHGLRAKDKTFNAETKTDFDQSIGKVNIVPQDIGRVILNLVNNAFYTVNDKAKQNIPGYEPIVVVSTKKPGDKVEIKVTDNGNGIPRKIFDKVFQPFYTTKPAGQGTGLGLSLAYDIVKAHGGEIKVETKEGTGSEFIIQLPA
jgi:signal transduction histidine kinase